MEGVYQLPAYAGVKAASSDITTGLYRLNVQITYQGGVTTDATMIISDVVSRKVVSMVKWSGMQMRGPPSTPDPCRAVAYAAARVLLKPGPPVSPLMTTGTRVPDDIELQDALGRKLTANNLYTGNDGLIVDPSLRAARTRWRKPRAGSRGAPRAGSLGGAGSRGGAAAAPPAPPVPSNIILIGRGITDLPDFMSNPTIPDVRFMDPKYELPMPIQGPRASPGAVTNTVMMAVYGTRWYDPRFYPAGTSPPPPGAAKWITNTELARIGFSQDLWKKLKNEFLMERVWDAVNANPDLATLLAEIKTFPDAKIILLATNNTWMGVMSRARVPRQGNAPAGSGANMLGVTFLDIARRIR